MLTFIKGKVSLNAHSLFQTMKMTTRYSLYGLFLQAIFLNILFASPYGSRDLMTVKISMSANNVTLENVLHKIEQSTEFSFIYKDDEVPLQETVSINVEDEPLYNVLCSIASQSGLLFQCIDREIVLKKSKAENDGSSAAESIGKLRGKVTDAATNEPLIGVDIFVEGTNIRAASDIFGDYVIENLDPASVTILFQYAGYLIKERDVNIKANKTLELNAALRKGAYNLNEITVTGSISERTIRESANPITVITQNELENRNLNSLGIILQSVPGVVGSKSLDTYTTYGRTDDQSLADLNIRGYSPSSTISGGTKFILDDVEVYDYRAFSYIDPNQIEKIEVTRGPMSSTLYGSGSPSGIVQVFTKKGAGRLKVNFRTMLTSKESKYQDSNPLITDYSLGISGGMPDFGYSLSLDYQRYPVSRYEYNNGTAEEDWTASARINGNLSTIEADLNVQYSENTTGSCLSNLWYKVALADGWKNADSLRSTSLSDSRNENTGLALGLNLRQPITHNIYHNLTLGVSSLRLSTNVFTPAGTGSSNYYMGTDYDYENTSVKYHINMKQSLSSDSKVDVTGGAEYILREQEAFVVGFDTTYDDNQSQDYSTDYEGTRSVSTNSTVGFFAEAVWGFKENLFLTTGFRVEKNSSYGDNTGWYKTPRIGLTYIESLGEFTFKPRVSWGKSTQTIPELYKSGQTTVSGDYTIVYLPNSDLKPQTQQGYELGADVFYTNNFSFGVTYFNQKVANLIQIESYASEDLYTSTNKYVNAADADNHGVELNAKAVFNDFTVNAAGTIVNSTYGDGYSDSSASYMYEGGKVINIPSETFFVELSYRLPSMIDWSDKGGNISLSYIWRGSAVSTDYYSYYKTKAETGSSPIITYKEFDGYYTINSRADYWLLDNLSLFIDVVNLLNNQDIIGGYPRSGRRISFGFNCNF